MNKREALSLYKPNHVTDVIGQWKETLPVGMTKKVSIEGACEPHLKHK